MPSPTTIEPIIPPATGPPTPPEEEADELAAEAPAGEAVMVNGALATTAGGPAAAASDATGRFAALATAETTVVKAGAVQQAPPAWRRPSPANQKGRGRRWT